MVSRSSLNATLQGYHASVSFVELARILLIRQRLTFLLVFLATLAAVVAYVATADKEYTATSTLFVGENRPVSEGVNAVQLDDVLSRSYADLLGRRHPTAGRRGPSARCPRVG